MATNPLRPDDAKANIWVALLAFAVAAVALSHGEAGLTALVAALCGASLVFVRLRQERDAVDARLGLADALTHARELLARDAHQQALRVAHDVAERAQSEPMQRAAVELTAWCQLGLGRPEAARDALSWLAGSGAIDPYCLAAVEDGCGQSLWALHIVERAAKKGQLSREATLFRIDLCARLRGVEAACSLTLQQLARLKREDAERVLGFARASHIDGHAILALARAVATVGAARS
jgi:hypothetical protein